MIANRLSAVLAALALITSGPAFAADPDFHYLAADPSLRAQTQYANVVMGQATYVGKVLELDQSWEDLFRIVYPGSVVTDPDTGQWRMYYELYKSETQRFVAMATSDDGVNWTKPDLNITGTTKYTSNPNNNIVNNTSSQWAVGPSVFVDPNAPAAQRYRMTAVVISGSIFTLNAYSSEDGLNWSQVGTIHSINWGTFPALDAQNTAFWDPKTQQYIAYMRKWYPATGSTPMRRGVMAERSNAFDTGWTGPLEYTIDPKNVPTIGPGPNK
ncbi:MAG: hypothetical protein KKE86_06295, partial [Planctomycetes bacterium]|nr:hypothetical protein [Planctomycetota bacterium]